MGCEFPPVELLEAERQLLLECSVKLKTFDNIDHTITLLESQLMNDFPAEVFLQELDIVDCLLSYIQC